MKRVALTRVEMVRPWPSGHALSNHYKSPIGPMPMEPARVPVVAIGAPVKPSHVWTCGTDVVWPVYEMNGIVLPSDEDGGRPFVCRHQILAGD